MRHHFTADRILFFSVSMLLVCCGAAMEIRANTHHAHYLVVPGLISIVLGMGFAGAYFLPSGKTRKALKALTIMALNTAVLLGLVEGGCHVAKVDFNSLLKVREKSRVYPIYFREPVDPVGDVYFKRSGPASWSGRPLAAFLEINRGTDLTYADEEEVTIGYDADGFRNPEGLSDWEIVVAGDSFTESGYLEERELFTSVLARSLGKRVKNLGVSGTGNLTHSHYLEAFGRAPSLRAGVLAFFEGNDLTDNVAEARALSKFENGGDRPSREIGRESSFVRVLYRFVRDIKKLKVGERSYANADFVMGGEPVPMTIADAPPSPDALDEEALAALDGALDQWVASCEAAGADAHLLYVPCKRRVFDGMMTKRDNYPEPEWEYNDLPQFIEDQCEARGIRFTDATQALRLKAEEGVVTFNTILDTHLNREGQVVVGEVLAQALGAAEEEDVLVSVPAEAVD